MLARKKRMSHGRKRIYIGKISFDTRSRDLEDEFARFGRIRDFHMRDGFAFVTYESSRDADDAVYEMDGRRFDGARLIVEFARERGEKEGGREKRPQGEFRCSVEGLPKGTSWQDLKDHMRTAGDCAFVDTVSGGTKGVVEYRKKEDLERALKDLDGSTFKGEKIRVIPDGQVAGELESSGRNEKRSRSRSRSRSGSRKRSRSRSP